MWTLTVPNFINTTSKNAKICYITMSRIPNSLLLHGCRHQPKRARVAFAASAISLACLPPHQAKTVSVKTVSVKTVYVKTVCVRSQVSSRDLSNNICLDAIN